MKPQVLVAFGALFLTGAGGVSPPRPPLPAAVQQAITAQCAGWTFPVVDSERVTGSRPGDRPDWVSGDLDDDGQQDYAVQIMCPTGKMTPIQRLALLARGRKYKLFVLEIATDPYFLRVIHDPAHGTFLDVVMDEERTFEYRWAGDHFESQLFSERE